MLNGDSSQASEATPVEVEVSKKSVRNDVWRHLHKNQLCTKPNYSFNRIPRFIGSEEAANALKELPEFKNAKHIMVNPDRAQDVVRMVCLQSGKILYVQPPRIRYYLMTRLNVKEDATEEDLLKALTVKELEETGSQLGLSENIPLDLVVVGSVAVSKDGHRIGRGHSCVDLCLGILRQINFIKPETLIVTTIHDSQVLDSIPSNILVDHDFPVDIIVTPTQVIRTNAAKNRPSGVLWSLISERRLKQIPLLSELREKEVGNGKPCVLKETESEAESENEGINARRRRFFKGRGAPRGRRMQQNGATHSESEHVEGADGEKIPVRKQRTFYRRYYRYRRNTTNDDGTVTKHSYRNKAWQLLQKNHVVTTPRNPYNRIPGFKGAEDAAQVLRQHELYQKATSVMVNTDKTHEAIRLACLEDGKKLFVLLPRIVKEFVIRVDLPEGEDKPELKDVVTRQGLEQYGTKLDMNDVFTLDLLVLGSLAVSKEGLRIGKGNGHADLSYALLMEMHAITPDTPIITTVHDYQIFETFPPDLPSEHDVPVDLIVTGTQAFAVEPRKPRPKEVMWNLLTARNLTYMPLVSAFRDKEVESGKTCDLKEEDPNEVARRRRNYRSYNFSESEHNEMGEAESGDHTRRMRGPRRYNRQRRSTNERGDVENGAESAGNISPDTTSARKKKSQVRKSKPQIDFSIKLSNIKRHMRIRDLRNALQERSVKPTLITWMGFKGFCYLHFAKPASPTGDGDVQQLTGPDSILESLSNLTLYASDPATEPAPDQTSPNKLIVQLAKPLTTRIEPVEQTAV